MTSATLSARAFLRLALTNEGLNLDTRHSLGLQSMLRNLTVPIRPGSAQQVFAASYHRIALQVRTSRPATAQGCTVGSALWRSAARSRTLQLHDPHYLHLTTLMTYTTYSVHCCTAVQLLYSSSTSHSFSLNRAQVLIGADGSMRDRDRTSWLALLSGVIHISWVDACLHLLTAANLVKAWRDAEHPKKAVELLQVREFEECQVRASSVVRTYAQRASDCSMIRLETSDQHCQINQTSPGQVETAALACPQLGSMRKPKILRMRVPC